MSDENTNNDHSNAAMGIADMVEQIEGTVGSMTFEPTPNADEMFIVTHQEEVKGMVTGLMDSVRQMLHKIGALLILSTVFGLGCADTADGQLFRNRSLIPDVNLNIDTLFGGDDNRAEAQRGHRILTGNGFGLLNLRIGGRGQNVRTSDNDVYMNNRALVVYQRGIFGNKTINLSNANNGGSAGMNIPGSQDSWGTQQQNCANGQCPTPTAQPRRMGRKNYTVRGTAKSGCGCDSAKPAVVCRGACCVKCMRTVMICECDGFEGYRVSSMCCLGEPEEGKRWVYLCHCCMWIQEDIPVDPDQ